MKKLILFAIILLAFVLRFNSLDSYPAFNADEAAIGYNVYSLLQTGKDEHGNSWPIHFQSFNDYKPGLYFYVVLPFVKVLGLNEWAIRIPGALSGVLTVFALYYLVKELFNKNENLALFSALLLAISPWHIHFSRGGWEVNFGTFLLTAGLLFLIKSINKGLEIKKLLLSFLFFVATLYTYHSLRIVMPILVFGIIIFYKDLFLKNWKKLLIAILFAAIVSLPLIIDLAKPAILSRAQGVGIFSDLGPKSRVEEQRSEHDNYSGLFPKFAHNRVVNYGFSFLHNWTKHYWGEFLFLSGDEIQRNKVPETGQLYLIEIVSILFGLYLIAKNPKEKSWLIVILWLIIAPIAASLTFQSPHALRAQNMIIPLVIISAYGFVNIINLLAKTKFKIPGYMFISLLILWSLLRYVHQYYVHMAKDYPYSSQYGVKELVDYLGQNKQQYKKIIVTDRYDQPYILFLFYSKYSPAKFQTEHLLTGRDNFGFSTVSSFDSYEFTSIDFEEMKKENSGSLIIGTDEEIPDKTNVLKNIYGSNGYLYFQVVGN